MIVRIRAGERAGETERMYENVLAIVVGSYEQQLANKDVPFLLVRPQIQKCALVQEIYVRKDCIG